MGQGTQHGFRRAFQLVRKPYQKSSAPHPDCVADTSVGIELNRNLRHGGRGTKLAVSFLEDGEQPVSHCGGRLARLGGSGLSNFLCLAASSWSASNWM